MKLKIEKYNIEYKNSWNNYIYLGENSNFLFHRDFMDYHSNRFIDASVLIYDDGNLVGLFPANIKDNTVYSHQGLTYGGLILADRRNVQKTIEYFHVLFSYYSSLGIKEIIYKPLPTCFCRNQNELEHFVMNMLGAEILKVDTGFVIDNRNELKFQERRKRSLKKGEKAGTEIRIDNDFDAYWNSILVPNLKEKFGTSPVHSLEEIKLLHSRFPDKIKQANAYIDNQITAGVTLFEFENMVHCQYISSNDFGRDSGAIDYLFNNLIHLYKPTVTYFSLGTANNNGKDINTGLCEWKEGWSARIHAHFHYKFKTENINVLEKYFKKDV